MRKTLWMSAAALAVGTALVGCDGDPEPKTVRPQAPSLALRATDREMIIGESLLIFAQTRNLMGLTPEIRWTTTQGQLTRQDNGRRALFTSDRQGVATVTAEVDSDAGTLRQSVRVTIHDIRP